MLMLHAGIIISLMPQELGGEFCMQKWAGEHLEGLAQLTCASSAMINDEAVFLKRSEIYVMVHRQLLQADQAEMRNFDDIET